LSFNKISLLYRYHWKRGYRVKGGPKDRVNLRISLMFNFFYKNRTQWFSDSEIFRKRQSVIINKIKYPPKLMRFSITTPNKVLWTTSSSLTLWSRRNFCCQKASMMINKVCNATVGGHGWMMALFVRDPKSSEMYTRCEVTYNVKVCGILFVGYYIKILLSCQVHVSCLSSSLCPNVVPAKSWHLHSKYSLSRFLSKQFVILL
jgi:hypothetical protein